MTKTTTPFFCKRFLFAAAVLVSLFASFYGATAQTAVKFTDKEIDITRWVGEKFKKGTLPPFSFVLDGRQSADFLRSWEFTSTRVGEVEPGQDQYIFSWKDKRSGLIVKCVLSVYRDFGAVEWVLNFQNTGETDSPTITDVRVTDLSLENGGRDDFMVYYADGCNASRADFHPREKELGVGDSLYMSPVGGRSSDQAFPFFNIAASPQQGVMVAIGWTGGWYADMVRSDAGSVALSSGMKTMELYLYPGESIRTPSACLLFWQGADRMAGHNKFRRFVLEHQTRKIDGKRAEYPLSTGFNFNDPPPCNEYTCLTEEYAVAMVKRYKQFGLFPEVFWLDAGWYTGAGDAAAGQNWSTVVGNWEPDKVRFPNGLRAVSDEIHKLGAKFMVWFEPERVRKGTIWADMHPEWMLDTGGGETFLFDLGNPEACRWMCEYIGDMLEEQGIDYYRQDFNMSPAPYWQACDEPGRVGMKEIRHIEGLYTYWDYLLERFPNLIIDNCAAGGRRIDFETTKRSASLWRTDYKYGEPIGYQCHTYGLNFYLPLSGTGTLLTDRFTFRSSLSTAMIYNWKISDPTFSINEMQACLAEFREFRPYFYEDYYPLTGLSDKTGDDVWLAYQLHDPVKNEGVVVAFRRDNAPQGITVKLCGLTPSAEYEVVNYDSKEGKVVGGSEAAAGMELRLDNPRSSLVLKYKIK